MGVMDTSIIMLESCNILCSPALGLAATSSSSAGLVGVLCIFGLPSDDAVSESVRAKDDMRVSIWKTSSSGEIGSVVVVALNPLLGAYLSVSK